MKTVTIYYQDRETKEMYITEWLFYKTELTYKFVEEKFYNEYDKKRVEFLDYEEIK